MPPPPTPSIPSTPRGPTAGRRHVLGAAAALGLVALTSGCRVPNPLGDPAEDPTPDDTSSTAPVQDGDQTSGQDADLALAATTSRELTVLRAAATATVGRFPGLGPQVAPFLDLHGAHLAALARADRSAPASPSAPTSGPYVVPPDRQRAWQALLALERAGVSGLAEHAVAARSGAFARLLAGMSAGTAQRLAVAGSPA